MSLTQDFQKQVQEKMEEYFIEKLKQLKNTQSILFRNLTEEYNRQFSYVERHYPNRKRYFRSSEPEYVLLSDITEPNTYYTQDDCHQNGNNASIYSPRIDLTFSPIIKKSRGTNESIGVYKLTQDINLFKELHQVPFVKELELKLKEATNENLKSHGLTYDISCEEHNENAYINKRPLHLFGIEIENQKNAKHLMGDFLNAISLARIPVVIVPQERLISLVNMLRFSLTINELKEVPIYEMLSKVNILYTS